MSEITHLKLVSVQTVQNQSVIDTLEEALNTARDGGISSVGLAMVKTEGSVLTSFSDTYQGPALTGGVQLLLTRLVKALEEG